MAYSDIEICSYEDGTIFGNFSCPIRHPASIGSTRIASHLGVHGFVHGTNVGKIPKNDEISVAYRMFIDGSYIHYICCFNDCASFVYTTIYKLL